jgi:4-hydroxybenzoate polyprenyltransferase
VRPNALNLPGLLLRHGIHVGFWLVAVALVVSYALVLWRLPRTPAGLALGCALVMWAFDLTNKQTFFNHYMLPLGLLLIAVAAATPQDRDETGAVADPAAPNSAVSYAAP